MEFTRKDLARFWSKVEKTNPYECWLWTGAMTNGGYGIFVLPTGTHTTAHRASFLIANGSIEERLYVDHKCRVRNCVNPNHLEAVTNRENSLRGLRGRMVTECVNGHPYTEANTIIRSNGRRQCKECRKAHDKKRGRDAAYWREYKKKREEKSNGRTQ